MPKSKHGPALFELISKPAREEELRVRVPHTQPATAVMLPEPVVEVVLPQAEPAMLLMPLVEAPPMPVKPPSAPPAVLPDDAGAAPPFRIAGGKVYFSLNQRGAGAVLAALGLLLISAHYLGYKFGEKHGRGSALAGMAAPTAVTTHEIEEARRGPVSRRLFEGIGDDPTATTPVAETAERSALAASAPQAAAYEPSPAAWVQGHTYIVVQDFRKDAREDAEMARDYLVQNGVHSAILERSGAYPYRLISGQGFNRDDKAERKRADEHQQRIRRLGQAFLEAGGRYDFKTAYFMKMTGATW